LKKVYLCENTKLMDVIKTIKIADIVKSPYQGRILDINFDDHEQNSIQIKELVKSIETNGLLQPVSVREIEGSYELIDGHRRVEAYKLLGKAEIKAIVTEMDERKAQIMSVVANLQRSNLNNIERAMAFRKILDQSVFGSQKDLSNAIGKDETYVGDTLNILNMDQRIIDDLVANNSVSDVRLLRLIRKSDKVDSTQKSDKQWELYQQVLNKGLDRVALQKLIKNEKQENSPLFTAEGSYRKMIVKVKEKLNPAQRIQFETLLNQKIGEVLDAVLNSETE